MTALANAKCDDVRYIAVVGVKQTRFEYRKTDATDPTRTLLDVIAMSWTLPENRRTMPVPETPAQGGRPFNPT